MLNTYNSSAQSVATNDLLVFTIDQLNRGTATSHVPGSNTFTLNFPGIYEVTFNGSAASADTNPITVQLFKNGVPVPNAIGETLSTAITDFQTVCFSTLIEVDYACLLTNNVVSLTVVNTGPEATFNLANVEVIKVR